MGASKSRGLTLAIGLLTAAAITVPLVGQPPPAAQSARTSAESDAPDYVLTPGDVVDVHFSYNPEMNQRVTVRPDGFVSLQMIGDLQVQRMSPANLAARLHDSYGKYYRHPDLTVTLVEFGNQRAFVGGEVATPGVVPLRGPVNCLQAVLQSGGAKPTGKLTGVLLIRHRDDNVADVRTINLKAVMAGHAPDIQLKPYDVLIVPRTIISKVDLFVEHYINGMLPRSLVFPYNLNTTVSVQ
jgi:polysaccharide export outer membrane protein